VITIQALFLLISLALQVRKNTEADSKRIDVNLSKKTLNIIVKV